MSNKLAILCSGQGGQHPGMFDMIAHCPEAEAIFNDTKEILGEDPRVFVKQENTENLFTNRSGQILCCALSLALYAVLQKYLSKYRVLFAGYSVGELSAWGLAGCLTPHQVLELAAHRAELMNAVSPAGAGLAGIAGLPRYLIEDIANKTNVWIAISNTEEAVVVGGMRENLDLAVDLALKAGAATARCLKVAVPSHTPLLEAAVAPLQQTLLAMHPASPGAGVRLISGLDGEPVFCIQEGAERLAKQVGSMVRWDACMQACVETGSQYVLELGPGTALARMAHNSILAGTNVRAMEDFHSLSGLLSWLK